MSSSPLIGYTAGLEWGREEDSFAVVEWAACRAEADPPPPAAAAAAAA